MSLPAVPLSEGAIAASNVLPAYDASVSVGVDPATLERRFGWRREVLAQPDAWVTGASTYAHMAFMAERGDYPAFVGRAVGQHDIRSLGVVGLAGKTSASVGAALRCHARYQGLVNRTATYTTGLEPDGLVIRERRPDASLGADLVSDYALCVAARLLSQLVDGPTPVRALRSRRAAMPDDERAAYASLVGAPVDLGAGAALVVDPAILDAPVARADAELQAYFGDLLRRADPEPDPEPAPIAAVRAAIRDRVRDGHPALGDVARGLGVSSRTLQRQLAAHGARYADLLDDTLRDLAASALRDPRLTVADVAYLLGYVEQASFYRAHRRWFGHPPRRPGG